MYSAFMFLVGCSFVAQYVQDAMMEELYGVSAAEEEFEDP
jgi:hypothetical protein